MLRHRLNHWFNFHVHLSVHGKVTGATKTTYSLWYFNAFIKYFKITKNKANNIHVPFCRVLATYTYKADPIHHLSPHSYITLPFVWFFCCFFFSILVFVLLVFFFCYHLYLVHIFNLFFIIIFFNIYLIHMFTIGTHQTIPTCKWLLFIPTLSVEKKLIRLWILALSDSFIHKT